MKSYEIHHLCCVKSPCLPFRFETSRASELASQNVHFSWWNHHFPMVFPWFSHGFRFASTRGAAHGLLPVHLIVGLYQGTSSNRPWRPYFMGMFPYIGLKNRPYIWNRYLQFRILKWPLTIWYMVFMWVLYDLYMVFIWGSCGWYMWFLNVFDISHLRTMVLVYKNLQNWVFFLGQMLVNIPDMEHMGMVLYCLIWFYNL